MPGRIVERSTVRIRPFASPHSGSRAISAIRSAWTASWHAVVMPLKPNGVRPSSSFAFFEDARIPGLVVELLRDDAAPVRAAAASTLARVDHPARVEVLLKSVNDPDSWVRYSVLRSLGTIGAKDSLDAVLGRLEHDAAAHVRLAAIDVIGRLKPPDVLDILGPLTRSANPDIARAAIGALGHVDQSDALAILASLTRATEPWQRLAAVTAIGVRGETRIPEILQWVAAADGDSDVAHSAIEALAQIGRRDDGHGGEATRALMALTAEPARRQSAISALSRLHPRQISDVAGGPATRFDGRSLCNCRGIEPNEAHRRDTCPRIGAR